MILAVHIGNTNITVGAVRGKDIVFQARLRTDTTKTSDEYAIDLKMLLTINNVSASDIDGAIIASVVPQVLNQMKTGLKKLFGKPILVVGPGIKTGLNIRIDNPAQTGSDLVVGCVAAQRLPEAPAYCGRDGYRHHHDGPGPERCPDWWQHQPRRAHFHGGPDRAGSPAAGPAAGPAQAYHGRNTVECMRSGILNGAAAMLDGMVARMEEELGDKVAVITTGRMAQYVVPLCKTPMHYDRDLIIKGLAILYAENTKPKPDLGGYQ